MTAPLPTLAEASRRIGEGTLDPVELTERTLERAAALNGTLFAFIRILRERALAAAKRAAEEIRAGKRRGPLHGIPYGLKDIYDVAGIATTAHSRLLLENIAKQDSTVTQRLEAAGMVLIGKLATHEFAIGGPSFDLPFPPARNPWNVEYFTGGSSSGSGAAVAARILPLAMGTDTGGSVRMPAAYCGCVGLKPTYGRISRRGVVPLSYSLDHCGPLTATVEDSALALQVLAGYDPLDPASSEVPCDDYLAGIREGVAGLRVGYARAFDAEAGAGAEEMAALDAVAEQFRRLGASVSEVKLPPVVQFHAAGRAISYSEEFALHRQDLIRRPEMYGRIARERLMLGAFVSGARLVQAGRLRRILIARVNEVFRSGIDVLVTAPIPGPAARLADVDTTPWREAQPITTVFNTTGHPALCLPCGFARNGLPLSLQLVAAPFAEAVLLRAGHAYERAAGWYQKAPTVPAAPARAGATAA